MTESFDITRNDQNLTVTGHYTEGHDMNWGSTDTSYPAESADLEITSIIWHKHWGGNIIDIDVTDLLDDNVLIDIEMEFLSTK